LASRVSGIFDSTRSPTWRGGDKKLQQDGFNVAFLQLDVADETSIDQLAKELASQIDHLDVLSTTQVSF
jgi:NAD(P)-dependent dehydrogenase (short-subunit alcohol dehydrogenase family)